MQTRGLTVEDVCNKLRPIIGSKVDEIYFRYSIADGREEREEIAQILGVLYRKYLSNLLDNQVLLEPPKEALVKGEYNLATIKYANKNLYTFCLREQDWQRHVCITGMSGSGKTTLALTIIEELLKHKKAFLVFDWKKSFRPLLSSSNNLNHFTIGDESVSNFFKVNINKPPKGIAPKEWITVLSDLLTESFLASFGVHKILLETLDESFKEWGVYEGSENYPTWNHIKWVLEERLKKNKQGRETGWLESALRIATVLTFGEFGRCMNYKGEENIGIEDLLDKQVIMELNALGTVEKKFFCEYLLTYIYKLKKARQNKSGPGFDHAILVDEAHNIFLRKPTSFSNESVTDMIYREMREYGTSLICLDQHISKISDTVKGNSACHIAFQQQLPADIDDISDLMLMRDRKQYFSQLPVGTAIVKLSERYTSPFLIETSLNKTRNANISDNDIKSRMNAVLQTHEFEMETDSEFNKAVMNPKLTLQSKKATFIEEKVEKKENQDYSKDSVHSLLYDYIIKHLQAGVSLEKIEKTLEESTKQGGYTTKDIVEVINMVFAEQLRKNTKFKNDNFFTSEALSGDEQVFIEFLQENPNHNLSTVELYKRIGLSTRKGTSVKGRLLEKSLIRIDELRYDKGWKKIIHLNKNHIHKDTLTLR